MAYFYFIFFLRECVRNRVVSPFSAQCAVWKTKTLFMLRRSIIQAFLNAEFSHASIPPQKTYSEKWAPYGLQSLCVFLFFNLGTCRAVYQEDFESPIGQPCLWRGCFSLQDCMQWEEDMVWARQGTQIDGAARLMKICSRRCREAGSAVQRCVIVLGECNATPLPSHPPLLPFIALSLTLRHSSPSPFVVLLIRAVPSLSPSPAFFSLAASHPPWALLF